MLDSNDLAKELGREGVAVREKVAELAEPSLKHLPPFDRIKYRSTLDRFLPYIKEYPPSEQEPFVRALIQLQRSRIGGRLFSDPQADKVLEPIRKKVDAAFIENWVQQERQAQLFSGDFTLKDVKSCLVEVMKERLPSFKNQKAPPALADPSVIYFGTPLTSSITLLIGVDRGTMMPGRFTPYLAISDPPFSVEIGALLGGDMGTWYYSSPANCKDVANEMVTVIETLLPVFVEKMEEGLRISPKHL